MENVLEIAVWVAAALLVVVLLLVGMVIAIDRSEASVPTARRRTGRSATFWWGVGTCAAAALHATVLLVDPRAYLPWRRLYVERWQVGLVAALLAFVGLRLVMLGRRFKQPNAVAHDGSKSNDFASTPEEGGQ